MADERKNIMAKFKYAPPNFTLGGNQPNYVSVAKETMSPPPMKEDARGLREQTKQ